MSEYEAMLADADIDALHDLHDLLISEYANILMGTQMNQSENANPEAPVGENKPEETGTPQDSQTNGESSPKENASSNQGGRNN